MCTAIPRGLGEELYDHIRDCEEVENRGIVEEEVDDAIFDCIIGDFKEYSI